MGDGVPQDILDQFRMALNPCSPALQPGGGKQVFNKLRQPEGVFIDVPGKPMPCFGIEAGFVFQ